MSNKLEGKVAIVTGASQGIGKAISLHNINKDELMQPDEIAELVL